jgi:hypothetical protein
MTFLTRAAVLLAGAGLAAADSRAADVVSADIVLGAKRVLVLGDAITHDGRWLANVVAWMEKRGTVAEVIDAGLPGETLSGMTVASDGAAGRLRPDLSGRLDDVLRIVRPDVVLACAGTQCGLYQPLDDDRFAGFKAGIERLHAAVAMTGATIVHLTPPVYDQRPDTPSRAGNTDYDAVLEAYATWLVSKRADGWLVIDVHGPMKSILTAARAGNPAVVFAPNAVDPNAEGHWAISRAVLRGFGDEAAAADETPAALAAFLPEVTRRLHLLRDAYVAASGPLPPGLPPGLPIAEAEAQARVITESLRSRRAHHMGFKSPSGEWRVPLDWPRPRVVDPGPAPEGPVPPPADAVVLFDGSDLRAWRGAERWKVADGVATVGRGVIVSKDAFGDCQVHLEFRTPSPPRGKGQARGNSGLFMMEQYEIQILDSHEDGTDGPLTYPDGQCGALYRQQPPAVNACRAPGAWQTYDVLFTRPRFHADGTLATPARVSVLHNGIAIHAGTVVLGRNVFRAAPTYTHHADALPIKLQDHGNPVEFRSIWVRPFEPVVPRPTLTD